MSYDFRILDIHDNELYWCNYTSNIYEMVDTAYNKIKYKYTNIFCHWTDELMYGDTPYQYLKDLIKELEDHEDYKKYNPKNGWGSYTTFIQVLKEIKTEMEKYDLNKIKIEVSC